MNLSKELIYYAIFGILTTFINIVTYAFLSDFVHIGYQISTILAWMVAVLFAFYTNKKYVFQSSSSSNKFFIKELLLFMISRVLSLILDIGIMIIGIEYLGFDDLWTKILANIFVILFNYFASKFIIFNKRVA